MAYYSGSQTSSVTRKTPYVGATARPTFDDESDVEIGEMNDIDHDYPIIRDVPFYNTQQRRSHDAQSNRYKNLDGYYTPQVKRKRGSENVDQSPFDSFSKQLESVQMAISNIDRKVDMMLKKDTYVEKQFEKVKSKVFQLIRQVHKNSVPNNVPDDVPKVMYGGRNILAGPIEPTPSGLMKQLINKLFTKDEIMLRYHEESNERTEKIKEAVKAYFFRDDDDNFEAFWTYDGKITRGNQRRGHLHRKKKDELEQQKKARSNSATREPVNDDQPNN